MSAGTMSVRELPFGEVNSPCLLSKGNVAGGTAQGAGLYLPSDPSTKGVFSIQYDLSVLP